MIRCGIGIGRIAFPLGQLIDPMRTTSRVINGAEQKMKSPQDFLPRKMGNAAGDRIHKHQTRTVEVLGYQFLEKRRIFGRKHGPQP